MENAKAGLFIGLLIVSVVVTLYLSNEYEINRTKERFDAGYYIFKLNDTCPNKTRYNESTGKTTITLCEGTTFGWKKVDEPENKSGFEKKCVHKITDIFGRERCVRVRYYEK